MYGVVRDFGFLWLGGSIPLWRKISKVQIATTKQKSKFMLNLLSKAKPWVVASMLAATSLFGQSTPQKGAAQGRNQNSMQGQNGMMQSQMMSGYNAPSSIDVCSSWDVFTTGSFIYWQASEDNLQLGINSDMTGSQALPLNGTIINMDFGFKPGFKVGLGMNMGRDNWTLYSEYTWLQTNNSASFTEDDSQIALSLWTIPARSLSSELHSISGKWHLHLNLLDLVLQRNYYVGSQLTFSTYFGGRAAWINQKYHTTQTETTGSVSFDTSQKSESWAVGARAGLDADWLLGYGIRFYGKTAFDALYTQYGRHAEIDNPTIATKDVNLHEYAINTIRPHSEIELGFGWGSYFDNNNWHIDLAAGYNFQVFFDQNMFIQFVGESGSGVGSVVTRGGNLYLQGLTTSVRLDF